MILTLEVLLVLLGVPAVLASLYLLLATLLSGRSRVPARSSRTMRFDVIVPAHNEESVIERTVKSLLRIDWPRECFRVVVVADNCTDATADTARRAGAEVMERRDDS